MKACSFFGHRDTPQTEELKQKVSETVERLMVEEGADTFLFGSRSNFDELCHMVVTELKEKYPYIQRIAYLCKHETGCLVGEGAKMKQQIKQLTGRDVYVSEYEDIRKSDRVNSAGRASYVERNQEIINISDFCVFYYNPCFLPYKRKYSKVSVREYQPKSGTGLVFDYAWKRRWSGKDITIINLYKEDGIL
jgi:uncharacterized phage-like protein YoqJ